MGVVLIIILGRRDFSSSRVLQGEFWRWKAQNEVQQHNVGALVRFNVVREAEEGFVYAPAVRLAVYVATGHRFKGAAEVLYLAVPGRVVRAREHVSHAEDMVHQLGRPVSRTADHFRTAASLEVRN